MKINKMKQEIKYNKIKPQYNIKHFKHYIIIHYIYLNNFVCMERFYANYLFI